MTIQQLQEGPTLVEKQARTIVKDEADAIARKEGAYEKLLSDISLVQGIKHRQEVLSLVNKLDQRENHKTIIDMKEGYLEISPAFAKQQFQDKLDHFDFAKEVKRAADLIHSDKCHTPPGMLAVGGVLLAAEAKGGRPETIKMVKEINLELHRLGDHRCLIATPDGNTLRIIILNDVQPIQAPKSAPIDRT
jgi:hypothetical protein